MNHAGSRLSFSCCRSNLRTHIISYIPVLLRIAYVNQTGRHSETTVSIRYRFSRSQRPATTGYSQPCVPERYSRHRIAYRSMRHRSTGEIHRPALQLDAVAHGIRIIRLIHLHIESGTLVIFHFKITFVKTRNPNLPPTGKQRFRQSKRTAERPVFIGLQCQCVNRIVQESAQIDCQLA